MTARPHRHPKLKSQFIKEKAVTLNPPRTQSFIIPDKPNTNHRARVTVQLIIERPKKEDRRGHMRESRNEVIIKGKAFPFMDPEYTAYKSRVTACAKKAGIEMYERCRITIIDHMPMKGTDYKKKQNVVSELLARSDLDNLKAIKDGLNEIAFKDDKHALWENPQVAYGGPEAKRYVEVRIVECHWTEFITDEGKQYCKDYNYLIPYPEETNGSSEGNRGLFGKVDITA